MTPRYSRCKLEAHTAPAPLILFDPKQDKFAGEPTAPTLSSHRVTSCPTGTMWSAAAMVALARWFWDGRCNGPGATRVIIVMQHTAKGKPRIIEKCSLPLISSRPIDLLVSELTAIGSFNPARGKSRGSLSNRS